MRLMELAPVLRRELASKPVPEVYAAYRGKLMMPLRQFRLYLRRYLPDTVRLSVKNAQARSVLFPLVPEIAELEALGMPLTLIYEELQLRGRVTVGFRQFKRYVELWRAGALLVEPLRSGSAAEAHVSSVSPPVSPPGRAAPVAHVTTTRGPADKPEWVELMKRKGFESSGKTLDELVGKRSDERDDSQDE